MWKYLVFIFFATKPIYAVPVIPSFNSATSTSRTETQSSYVEEIREVKYNSGYTYSVTGTNIKHDGTTMSAPNTTVTETVNGTTYTWTGLDLGQKPNWSQAVQGNAFQFTEVYQGPSVESITDITKTVESSSVTDTTIIFSQ
tara:strand:+ start:261 stop:686 length:426 start_codon:yes stop_codon:yes gene_type:complete